jgi:hypothetical protein
LFGDKELSGARVILFSSEGGMTMLNPNSTGTSASTELLADLVYELLDAHCDTLRLADEADGSIVWAAHLSYLRDLQRVGRETLARVPVGAG